MRKEKEQEAKIFVVAAREEGVERIGIVRKVSVWETSFDRSGILSKGQIFDWY
jgi:hypothetical protein